jgi:hypothetical protein
MAREDWTREEQDDRRRREDERGRRRLEDYGQADYSTDYAYDPDRRTGYRADDSAPYRDDEPPRRDYIRPGVRPDPRSADDPDYVRRMEQGDYRRGEPERHEGRSWVDRAGEFFSGAGPRHDDRHDDRRDVREARAEDRRARRRGPSDRVLWAVIVERLEDERRLDLRDVDVIVEGCEVTLNGTVRRKEDKRRIEDIADIEGVRHVQNNLRVRDRDRGWTLI